MAFANNIAGCEAFNDKKATGLSGVTAKGQTLTIKLINADPTFISQVSMPFFAAVKPNMAIDAKGISVYPSAGPYKIVSRDPGRCLVLQRNTFYKGTRPANPDQIVFTTNTDQNQSLLQVKSGEVNYDLGGVPAVAERPAGGRVRRQQEPLLRQSARRHRLHRDEQRSSPFNNLKARQAANWAVDRPALLRTRGKFGGTRTDQILAPAAPGLQGRRHLLDQGCEPDEGEADLQRWRRRSASCTRHRLRHQLRADREVQPRAGGFKVT